MQGKDEERYQVRITGFQDDAARQRVVRFLSSLDKQRSEAEILQLLAHLPVILTARASPKTAHRLRERLESLGATVEINLLAQESSSPKTPLPSDTSPSLSPTDSLEEEQREALSLTLVERVPVAEPAASLSIFGMIKKAFLHYGEHFLLLYGISIIPNFLMILTIAVILVGWGLGSLTAMRIWRVEPLSLAQKLFIHGPLAIGAFFLVIFFAVVLTQMGVAALILATVQTLRNIPLSVKEAFVQGLPYVLPLLLASLLFLLCCALTFLPLLLAVFLSILLKPSWEVSLLIIGGGSVLTLLLLAWTILQNFLYPFPVVVEGLGPIRALQRSRVLMGGQGFFSSLWQKIRLLILFLLLSALSMIVGLAASNIFLLFQHMGKFLLGEKLFQSASLPALGIVAFSAVIAFLLHNLPVAFMMICFTLFYFDRVYAMDGGWNFTES